jgi:WD40 repeat protein
VWCRWYPKLDEDTKSEAVLAVELEGITVLELSSDGLTLAVCIEGELLLYDTRTLVVERKTEELSRTPVQEGAEVVQLKWGPAGSGSSDHFLLVVLEGGLYSGQTSEGSAEQPELKLLSAEVQGSVDWSPEGTHVVCSKEGTIQVFKLLRADSKKCVTEVELFPSCTVDSVYWTHEGQLMVTVQTSVSIGRARAGWYLGSPGV